MHITLINMEIEMEFQEYVIRHMEKLSKCLCRCLDPEGLPVCPSQEIIFCKDPVCQCNELFSRLYGSALQEKCTIYADDTFLYGIFLYDQMLYILGPAAGIESAASRSRQYLQNYGSHEKRPIPHVPVEHFQELLTFFYGLICGDLSDSVNALLDRHNKTLFEQQVEQQYAVYHLSNTELQRPHMPYARERKIMDQITSSNLDQLIDKVWQPGILAKDDVKQCEYECVCAFTVISRNAMQAGVDESRAYGLSDLLLQNLSVARSIVEMRQIYEYGVGLFMEEIKKAVKERSQNIYIEKAKNYISKHIYEKIRLDDIAKDVGLNPSYLSGIFTQETGMPLSRYILERKIELSCNLLRYSDSSISGIAEYMQITPQNYFTKVFKEITGTTPAKYRKENSTFAFKNN